MKIMPVIGVRPQVIKAAPLIKILDKDSEVELLLVHSGQHYDYEMSKIFFKELDLPDPIVNLGVKGGTHAEQTAKIMLKFEKILQKYNPDVVVVFGDANTTIASALAAVKTKIPVAHVEAGLRSWDMRMPEEINRVLTDHISQVLYAPTMYALEHLKNEGISPDLIYFSGDTMYDSILNHMKHIDETTILDEHGLEKENYIVVTSHRAENVDDKGNLTNIVNGLIDISERVKIIFPVHPRTLNRLSEFGLLEALKGNPNIILIKPVGYFEMLRLIRDAILVLTDSGGIQKEAFILRTPCVTMRTRTEWIETIKLGGNILVGPSRERIVKEVMRVVLNYDEIRSKLESTEIPYGDGHASEKIVKDLKARISAGSIRALKRPVNIKEFID